MIEIMDRIAWEFGLDIDDDRVRSIAWDFLVDMGLGTPDEVQADPFLMALLRSWLSGRSLMAA